MVETDEWARQLHSIDGSRLVSVCSEEEMRNGLRRESSTLDQTRPLLTDGRYHHLVLGELRRCISRSVSDKKHDFFPRSELNGTETTGSFIPITIEKHRHIGPRSVPRIA
jgi:hypothetical protein